MRSSSAIASLPTGHEPRVGLELARLHEGGQSTSLMDGTLNGESRSFICYHSVPVLNEAHHGRPELPASTEVIVPVPSGYPASMIDLAGLPQGSPLLPLVRGGLNPQGIVLTADGRTWQLASYHPHNGGGGPPWDQLRHGFDTYLDHLLSWLARLS
jgi:hypothetical protein